MEAYKTDPKVCIELTPQEAAKLKAIMAAINGTHPLVAFSDDLWSILDDQNVDIFCVLNNINIMAEGGGR